MSQAECTHPLSCLSLPILHFWDILLAHIHTRAGTGKKEQIKSVPGKTVKEPLSYTTT